MFLHVFKEVKFSWNNSSSSLGNVRFYVKLYSFIGLYYTRISDHELYLFGLRHYTESNLYIFGLFFSVVLQCQFGPRGINNIYSYCDKKVCPYSLKDFQWSLSFINTKKCLCAVQWGSVQNIILFERYVKFSCCPKFSHPILGYFSRRQFIKLKAQGFVLLYKMCFNACIYCGTIRSHNKFSSFHFLIKYGLNLRPYYI